MNDFFCRCGATFRSYAAEARHRHNFPALCRKPKPPSAQFIAVSLTLCKSGKFETGQGTCAPVCMDQLGDPRKTGCAHACEVHKELADSLVALPKKGKT